MFDRLKNVVNSLLNKGMNQLETPEVLAEQAEEELQKNLKSLQDALTESITREKMLEKQIAKNKQDIASWAQRAGVAVQQNNDDIAKQCLLKRQECEALDQQYAAEMEQQKATSAAIKQKHADVQKALLEFRTKKDSMVSRAKASDAQAKAQTMAGSGGSSDMDKWEQKIAEKEAKSEALKQLSSEDSSSARTEQAFQNSSVDDELAALKQQMGGASEGPKLIVDTSQAPEDGEGK